MTRAPAIAILAAALGVAALPGAAIARHAPSYHTPGYRGSHRLPRVKPRVRAPLTIGTGENPSILVDGAGTAHIVWNEPVPGQADQLHYCRLPRGATACTASKVLPVDQPDALGNSPETNNDTEGPRALTVGNELLVLSNRTPNVVPEPGCNDPDPSACPSSDSNDYRFTSEDGGDSFGAPGVIGTNPVGFGAVTFGSGSPFIGTLASEPGQGLTFQAVHTGQFGNATASFGDAAAGGNGSCCLLAVDSATQHPVVALSSGGQIVVREWDGTGSPDDLAHWSTSPSFPGSGSRRSPPARAACSSPRPRATHAIRP